MRRKATIQDIARHAEVSVGTVSNVLNEKGRFSDVTRDRVLQTMRDLNFTPNALVRSLQSGKTNTVGVYTWRLQPQSLRSINNILLEGIADGLDKVRKDLLLYSTHPHDSEPVASTFLDGRVDGLILVPGFSEENIKVLADHAMPSVLLYQGEVPGFASVNVENIPGILAVVDHLVALGHQHIAFCRQRLSYDFHQRREGYLLGLKKHGLSPVDLPDVGNIFLDKSGVEILVSALLALKPIPTAIVAGDDKVAFLVWECLERHGLRVPEDISLVGFDDTPDASNVPGLTTVRQPAHEVGRQAALFIEMLIDGEAAENCRCTLPVELIVRKTTAPPKGSGCRSPRSDG